MKRTILTLAAAAMIGLGAASPSWAAHDSHDNGDAIGVALFALALGTAVAIAADSDDDAHYVHYRNGGRNDPRYGHYRQYDPKLDKCLAKAYRHNNSPYKCWKKAEKRSYNQHRNYDRGYYSWR